MSQFDYDRPFHRGIRDPDNEFVTLWLERTTYRTGSEFPGILAWLEVDHKEVQQISPLQFACEDLETRNNILGQLIREHTADKARNLGPLTMRLQGTIDAAVNGGVAKYKAAFFSGETMREDWGLVERLAGQLEEQGRLLGDGLQLHGQLAPDQLRPLHVRLVELYREQRVELGRERLLARARPRTANILRTPLPPLPLTHISETDSTSACYHEVELPGEMQRPARPMAPPLPPRTRPALITESESDPSSPPGSPPPERPPEDVSPPPPALTPPPPLLQRKPSAGRRPPPPVPPKVIAANGQA